MTYAVGDVLAGGYRIFDVKSGGMGVVYLCVQPPDRYYAVKTVHSEAVVNNPHAAQKFLEYFRGEVDSWIRVSREARHPNIVEALLYNEQEGWLFLEYVNGLSLQDAAGRRPLHMKHVRDWGLGIAAGMEVMHRDFSLIHRDLKPLNVLIEAKGLIPKISDLGIAKVAEGEEDNTIIGTRGYRAPETLVGVTTFCSDIYSYGATLYYMATGQSPTDGQQEPLVPPRRFNPRLPKPLEEVIVRCLAVDPKSRPQSFGEVMEALGATEATGEDDRYRLCAEHDFYFLTNANAGCPFCDSHASHREQLRGSLEATRTGGSSGLSPTVPQSGANAATLPQSTTPQGTVTGQRPLEDAAEATMTSPSRGFAGRDHTLAGPTATPTRSKLPLLLGACLLLASGVSFLIPGVPWALGNGRDPDANRGATPNKDPKSGRHSNGDPGNSGSGKPKVDDNGDASPQGVVNNDTTEKQPTNSGDNGAEHPSTPVGPWACDKCQRSFSEIQARGRKFRHKECGGANIREVVKD